ncbi:uncharacterized protein LOC131163656 [Malania oleifera]|uniref:uncharacterized protein LOC131163656 n=1 Tax=Malania oleifera TaxID=397392 RepID=UPI0025AE1955|nr:uncharacterized protein LOC131163656 [Malania oleifera]
MEGLYGKSNPRIQKLRAINGTVSPIIVPKTRHCTSNSPIIDPYASDVDSALIRYLRSGSPAAGIVSTGDTFSTPTANPAKYRPTIGLGNSGGTGLSSRCGSMASPLSVMENMPSPAGRLTPVFGTPVKVEEDVLVMDGILVGSVPGGRLRSSASSDSGGSSRTTSGNSCYKTEICRPWEDFASCRYGSNCQFAHGKEELRPTRFPNKMSRLSEMVCKSYTGTGSCTYGSKCRFVHHQPAASTAVTTAAAGSPAAPPLPQKASPNNITPADRGPTITITTTTTTSIPTASTCWSRSRSSWLPQDDGIDITLPHDPPSSSSSSSSANENQQLPTSSRDEVEAYIQSVLSSSTRGRSTRTRLPAFAEICPD